jgi:AcrR family transcriptional regulator
MFRTFGTLQDLFDAAVADALDEYGEAIDERLRGVGDPAERVAGGVRLSARMAESHLEIMRILRHRGLGHIYSDHGLARRALRDVEQGIAASRFTLADPIIALSAMGGSLLALLELRFARPDMNGDEAAENMAEMLLRMLGVPINDAREVARRPLPAAD